MTYVTSTRRGLRLFNFVSRQLNKLGVPEVSLQEDSLLRAAQKRTQLNNFGDGAFYEPFRKLLRSYVEESELTPFGRLFARINLLQLLQNRLRVEQAVQQHPEILDLKIEHPFIIAGLPRTGTTLLYNLLSQDPGNRPLLFWESLAPAPLRPGTLGAKDPRISQAKHIVGLIRHLAPKFMSIHPIDAMEPEECSRLQMNTFVSPYAAMENNIPSYLEWFLQLPVERLEHAYLDYQRQLQVLQWQRPAPEQWVLKSPSHLLSQAALQHVFPDVRMIQTHRDPHRVIPSTCSLLANYQALSSDRVNSKEIGQQVLRLCSEGAKRSLDYCQSSAGRTAFHIQYRDLMLDPIGELKRLYEYFGTRLSSVAEKNAGQWLKNNPANKHGQHVYSLGDFELQPAEIDQTFATYMKAFQIPSESRSYSSPDRPSTAGDSWPEPRKIARIPNLSMGPNNSSNPDTRVSQ